MSKSSNRSISASSEYSSAVNRNPGIVPGSARVLSPMAEINESSRAAGSAPRASRNVSAAALVSQAGALPFRTSKRTSGAW